MGFFAESGFGEVEDGSERGDGRECRKTNILMDANSDKPNGEGDVYCLGRHSMA